MNRISITNEASWFDADKAIAIKESSYWNGRNNISKVTGSEFEHEGLYITKSGKYILNHWSQWQGTAETYEVINQREAADWLLQNGIFKINLPIAFSEQKEALEALISDAEI